MISPVEPRDAQVKLLGTGTRVPSFGVQLRRNPREEQRSNMRNIYTVSAGGYQLQTIYVCPTQHVYRAHRSTRSRSYVPPTVE